MDIKTFNSYYDEYSKIFLKYFYNKKDFNAHIAINHHINNKVNRYIDFRNIDLIDQFLIKNYKKRIFKLLDLGCGGLDKSFILKKLHPKSKIFGIETKISDDPGHVEINKYRFNKPNFFQQIKLKYNINFDLYDGRNLDFPDNFFDIIMLYATLEHIIPKERKKFIAGIEKKLKKNGYFIIARCPQKNGLFETIADKLSLGSHLWRLQKNDFIDLFPKQKYEIFILKYLNNIFTEPAAITNFFYPILVVIDRLLEYVKWPFFSDYFLVLRKR